MDENDVSSACTAADVATPEKKAYLLNTILPAAIGYFTKHLKVVPVSGNLKVAVRIA